MLHNDGNDAFHKLNTTCMALVSKVLIGELLGEWELSNGGIIKGGCHE
jgi:hypothetical protein